MIDSTDNQEPLDFKFQSARSSDLPFLKKYRGENKMSTIMGAISVVIFIFLGLTFLTIQGLLYNLVGVFFLIFSLRTTLLFIRSVEFLEEGILVRTYFRSNTYSYDVCKKIYHNQTRFFIGDVNILKVIPSKFYQRSKITFVSNEKEMAMIKAFIKKKKQGLI